MAVSAEDVERSQLLLIFIFSTIQVSSVVVIIGLVFPFLKLDAMSPCRVAHIRAASFLTIRITALLSSIPNSFAREGDCKMFARTKSSTCGAE